MYRNSIPDTEFRIGRMLSNTRHSSTKVTANILRRFQRLIQADGPQRRQQLLQRHERVFGLYKKAL